VFVTPALLEAGVTGVAVIIGALVERGIISRCRELIKLELQTLVDYLGTLEKRWELKIK